jgi:hypothetical protein
MMPTALVRVREHWTLEKEAETVANFINEAGDTLSINFFVATPDIEADLNDLPSLRNFYRRAAERHKAALLEVDVSHLHGVKVVRSLLKVRLAPTGFGFIGSYTLPFSDRSLVLKVQSIERGMTGVREAAVMVMDKDSQVDETTGKILGWEQDPYDSTYKGDFMRNKADDPRYDAGFPDHPLSKVRRYLADLPESIEIDAALKTLQPFLFKSTRNPWKFWTWT